MPPFPQFQQCVLKQGQRSRLDRGIVQQLLRQLAYPPWGAIAITSGVFALMHLSVADPYAVVPLFVLSLGFGWAFERTGRLAAPIVMQAPTRTRIPIQVSPPLHTENS